VAVAHAHAPIAIFVAVGVDRPGAVADALVLAAGDRVVRLGVLAQDVVAVVSRPGVAPVLRIEGEAHGARRALQDAEGQRRLVALRLAARLAARRAGRRARKPGDAFGRAAFVRIEGQRPAVVGQGPVAPAEPFEDFAAQRVGNGLIGRQRDGAVRVGQGLLQAAELGQNLPAQGHEQVIARLEGDRAIEIGQRLPPPAELRIGDGAAVAQRRHRFRRQPRVALDGDGAMLGALVGAERRHAAAHDVEIVGDGRRRRRDGEYGGSGDGEGSEGAHGPSFRPAGNLARSRQGGNPRRPSAAGGRRLQSTAAVDADVIARQRHCVG
jgi:hypothetical protein